MKHSCLESRLVGGGVVGWWGVFSVYHPEGLGTCEGGRGAVPWVYMRFSEPSRAFL